MTIAIRAAVPGDADAIWSILEPILRAGETYALPRDWRRAEALAFWTGGDHAAFVAILDGRIVGSFYLRPNHSGGGGHVANAGYAVATDVNGRGVARAMAIESFALARSRGFTAMQFNFVVESNVRAIGLWTSLDFAPVGRLPGAFVHPTLGPVDALVMMRAL